MGTKSSRPGATARPSARPGGADVHDELLPLRRRGRQQGGRARVLRRHGLARIDAAEQNVNALSQCDMAMCWLDLQEVTHDGTWVWSDGSTPGYLPWNSQYDQPDDGYGPEADAIMNAGDVEVYDGTWFDSQNGDWAHALCNNNQADCADDIYLAPYMTGCPEGYDFPATGEPANEPRT